MQYEFLNSDPIYTAADKKSQTVYAAAHHLFAIAKLIHQGLCLAQPRHAGLMISNLAHLAALSHWHAETIESAEPELIKARDRVRFNDGKGSTNAHKAMLEISREIVSATCHRIPFTDTTVLYEFGDDLKNWTDQENWRRQLCELLRRKDVLKDDATIAAGERWGEWCHWVRQNVVQWPDNTLEMELRLELAGTVTNQPQRSGATNALPALNDDMNLALKFIKKAKRPVSEQAVGNKAGVTTGTVRRWCQRKGKLFVYGVRNRGNKEGYYYDPGSDLSKST